MLVYSVRDDISGSFDIPHFQVNEMTYKRTLINTITKHPDMVWSTNPRDFSVYYLGEYDEKQGVLKCGVPEFKFRLVDLLDINE